MFALTNGIIGLAFMLFGWFLFAIIIAAFINALMRPANDFAFASQNKVFWIVFLSIALIVGVDAQVFTIFYHIPSFIKTILWLISLSGAIYYLGPERQRMGGSGWSFGK